MSYPNSGANLTSSLKVDSMENMNLPVNQRNERDRRDLKDLWSRSLSLALPIFLLIMWELVYRLNPSSGVVVSAPSLISREFFRLVGSGELIIHSAHSLSLILGALALSSALAIPLGVAMGAKDLFYRLLDPVVELIRPIPPLALLPLAIVWLGIGSAEKLFILCVGTFPPIVLNTIHGVRSADPVQIRAARSMAATDRDVLVKVLIPSALPHMLIGLRIAVGFAFTVIVAAELVATRNGLGYLLTIGWRTYNLETIFVSILTIGLLAYGLEVALRLATKRLVKWQPEHLAPLGLLRSDRP